MNHHYLKRAQAAYAAAEATPDPRDAAAFRAAAETWERLAKPRTDTFSMEPCRRALEELKREVAEAVPPKAPERDTVKQITHGMRYDRQQMTSAFEEYAATIEF